MAYTPKTWECGETITADALNHIEQGIASSGGGTEPLVIHQTATPSGMILDRTWQEIFDAFPNAVLDTSNAEMGMNNKDLVRSVGSFNGEYRVFAGGDTYTATSADGYPQSSLT